jgi:glycerol-3-phosphate dehydrogenase
VIGGGVVGSSVALAAARRGVEVTLLEAEPELGLCASGTNSGILHTGFDSTPGELETHLILRSAQLRDPVLEKLGVPVLRTGAVMRPSESERDAVVELAARARVNGVETEVRTGGSLVVPGEAVTDPVAFTLALAAAAEAAGARIVCSARVAGLREEQGALVMLGEEGEPLARASAAVNCAGLFADEVARAAGDDGFRIYPRKGEFLVFDPPAPELLERIVLPVPSSGTKGVLVFPTVDGKLVAGPTAHDQRDKLDWSVRPEAPTEILDKVAPLMPELEGRDPIASYAGLRPAGDGVNYLIERSRAMPRIVHAAAIRSTGLSACLGIAEHVIGLLGEAGVAFGPEQPLRAGAISSPPAGPWWRRSADHWKAGRTGSPSGYPQA